MDKEKSFTMQLWTQDTVILLGKQSSALRVLLPTVDISEVEAVGAVILFMFTWVYLETPFKQQRKNKVWIPRTIDETERMNTMTRAIKQSQEAGCHLKWNRDGELKNVKIVYPRAESGGGSTHWLLWPCSDIICIYSLGRGRGRLVVIRCYSGTEAFPPSIVQNTQLQFNTFLPLRSPPTPLAIAKTQIQSEKLGNCPYLQALGEATSGTARGESQHVLLLDAWEGSRKLCLNTGGIEYQGCFLQELMQ